MATFSMSSFANGHVVYPQKEKKAVLVAQRAQSKKDKAKQRKAHHSGDQEPALSMKSNPVKKRVSFA